VRAYDRVSPRAQEVLVRPMKKAMK
jgi:hypothetical protein